MANPSDKQMLRDANGDLIPQYWDVVAGDFKPLTGSDGAQDTRLTGSNVEELYLIESLALTDTSTFNSGEIDVSRYKKVLLLGRNSHDVDIQITVTPGQVNSSYWIGDRWLKRSSTQNTMTLPQAFPADLFVFNTFFDELDGKGLMKINVRGKAIDTPTVGSLDIFIWGVIK